jgi:hypothetical protein
MAILTVSSDGSVTRINEAHEALTDKYYDQGIADARLGRPRMTGLYGDLKTCYQAGYRRGLREVSNNG